MIFLKRSNSILIIILFILLSKNFFPQDYINTIYNTLNGLQDSKVYDVLQDKDGKMWFATASGICTYDGSEWYYFKEDSNYKKTAYVRLKKDSQGYIWALPEIPSNPIVYFNGIAWSKIETPYKNKVVPGKWHSFDVCNINNNIELVIGILRSGILVYKKHKWKILNKKDGLLSDLIFDVNFVDGVFYLSTKKGVIVFNGNYFDNSLTQKIELQNAPIFKTKIEYINQSRSKSRLWLLSRNWIGFYQDNQLHITKSNFDLTSGYELYYYDLFFDNKKNIYFGNESSLYFLSRKNNKLKILTSDAVGTSTNGATSGIQDYENNIWVCSYRGINKLLLIPFTNLNEANGLLENEVTAISEFNNGEMVFGQNIGITIKLKNSFKELPFNYNKKKSKQIIRVLDIIKDSSNNIWFTSTLNGLGKIDSHYNLKWYKINKANETYFSVFQVQNGDILLGTKDGLYKLSNNSLQKILDIPKRHSMIRKIYQMRDGTILLGTEHGLICFNNDTLINCISNNYYGNDIFALYQDDKLGVLIGTLDGLYTLKKDTLIKYSSIKINTPIYFITPDLDGNIWFGTDNGVLRWNGYELRRYNTSDGLAGNETNRAAGFVDKKGRLWIGTDRGVSVYNKDYDYSYNIKPKIAILYYEDAHNNKYLFSKENSLSYNHNNVVFHYRGYSYINEKKLEYKVLLKNVNNEFKEEFLTKENFVRFNNLPHGYYKFFVKVKNEKGIWSKTVSTANFEIKKPYYNQIWFYSLIIIVFGFAVYTIQDYYSEKKYSNKLEKEVQDRTELLSISESKYKTLVNTSADGILVIDEKGGIDFCNKEALNLLGEENYEDIQGNDIFSFIKNDQLEFAKLNFQKNVLTGIGNNIEFTFIKKNGATFPAEINSALLSNQNDKNKYYVIILRDVTIYKKAQETLRNANIKLEERVKEKTKELSSLIEQSPLGIVIYNKQGNINEHNKSFNEILEITDESKIIYYNIFSDDYLIRNNYYLKLKNIFEEGGTLLTRSIHVARFENSIYQNNNPKWLKYRFYSIQSNNETIQNVIGIIEDVSEQYRLEEVTRKLIRNRSRTTAILEATENERKRISMDLHDGLGQILTTAKLKLEIFKLKYKSPNEIVNDALELILKAGREISNIVHNLHPIEIDKYGLPASVELLCEKIEKTGKIKINFQNENYIPIDDKKIELAIFRIVQESLNNITKHSKAESAAIKISRNGNDECLIIIEDNGIGFDYSESHEKKNGFGLINMLERSELIGGKIDITSKENRGTIISIKIPLGEKT